MATIYSHPPEDGRPGTELLDHLDDVAARVGHVVSADATTPAGESLRAVAETLAYVHDFGKATTYFQEYLLADRNPDHEEYRYHAPIGSFAAYYALDAQGFATETCLAGFVAVAKHHGRLSDIAEYVHTRAHRREGISGGEMNSAERQQNAVAKQLQDIDEHANDLATELFERATDGHGDWGSFYDGFGELLGEIADTVATSGTVPGVDRDALSRSCYALVIQCWSTLVLADKTSAAGAENSPKTYAASAPSGDRLDDYIETVEDDVSADPDGARSEQLNYHRSRARESILSNIESFADEDGSVATLTLPTGMGKTLSGLSAAFDLRDRLDGERVVYALPFTSIIDQVVNEVEEIYETDTAGRLLTAHHHLAETTIRDRDDEEADRNDDVAGMLAESWRAGLTVTTFVQLFESLAGPANRQSMKLPALRNSVVVLDEPQSLPLDWWQLVPRLVAMLAERYDATVIAMTATQPELFEHSTELVGDPIELVDDRDSYFEAVERVSYELDASTERYIDDQTGPKSYDAAADALTDSLDAGESALAVCNTIDSTRELTERVNDAAQVDVAEVYADELGAVGDVDAVDPAVVVGRVVERGDDALLHLSTRLRPADRLMLIEVAKALTERGYPLVTVSTQLVEAGVDISFDRVYRDLAPIDSIVQAAGRCNRSFERSRGRVTVWWLDAPGEQAKTPAEAVYNRGTSLLPVAADTLDSVRGDDGTLSETAVARDAVEKYYDRLHAEKDVGKQAYAEFVDEARADELGKLSLIDQRRTADVLVSRTDAERELAERLREADRSFDFETMRRLLDESKSFRISVPYYREDSATADAIKDLPKLVEDEGLYQLDVRRYDSYFDETIGFVVPESTVDHQFL
ncbi:CRISPR-associated endonuclease Cas3'' [Halococcus morrhuae DSM 1307]|uniref:CRISPR-associated endonuclease Cas3'' n=1 Tax=Halococcus morrhuae TaxID=2250 RepID=UPI003F835EE3